MEKPFSNLNLESEVKKDLSIQKKITKTIENESDTILSREPSKGKSDSAQTSQKISGDDFYMPENVDRINITEKIVKDKTTGKDVVFVKKETFYSDGNKDVTIYKK